MPYTSDIPSSRNSGFADARAEEAVAARDHDLFLHRGRHGIVHWE
jgi:hypothetical protein